MSEEDVLQRSNRLLPHAGPTLRQSIIQARRLALGGDLAGATTLLDSVEVAEHPAIVSGGGGLPTGGTTDQVLAKASNADFDTAWVAAGGSLPMVIVHDEGAGNVNAFTERSPFPSGDSWAVTRDDIGAVGPGPDPPYLVVPPGIYVAGGYVDLTPTPGAVGGITVYMGAGSNRSDGPFPTANIGPPPQTDPNFISSVVHSPTLMFVVETAGDGEPAFFINNNTDQSLSWDVAAWWFIQMAAT